jgi:hypothetical protein
VSMAWCAQSVRVSVAGALAALPVCWSRAQHAGRGAQLWRHAHEETETAWATAHFSPSRTAGHDRSACAWTTSGAWSGGTG